MSPITKIRIKHFAVKPTMMSINLFCSLFKTSASFKDDRENADAKPAESSSGENVPSGQKLPSNSEELVKCEIPKSESMETSSSSPRKHFTDTDPATGLVRNVRAVMSQKANKTNILSGKPLKEMTGHTGYLTFATLYAQHANVDETSEEGKQ